MNSACTCFPLLIVAVVAPAQAQRADNPEPMPQVDIKGSSAQYDPRRDDTATVPPNLRKAIRS